MTDTPAPTSAEQFKRLSVLIAVNAVDMLGFAMVLPILPFYAQDLGASPLMIGLIISSYSIAQLLSAPFWGRVSDRYGRRPALLFTDNESNAARLWIAPIVTPYVKDAFHRCVVGGEREAVDPRGSGTKAAVNYVLDVPAGRTASWARAH